MKLCAFREYDALATGVVVGERVVGLDDLNDSLGTDFGPDLDALVSRAQVGALAGRLAADRKPRSGWKVENLRFAPPIARPPKIWGIGLNFAGHARDLGASAPDEPAAWMRPATTLAGHKATIDLPTGVGRVTAEAEIAVVLGRRAKRLASAKEARDAVLGFAPVLDLTAEELLQKNPRNLTRAKSYDGFCVMGPMLVTTDEWEPAPATRIVTSVDGASKAGTVAEMRHDPYELVRFFSHVFTWEPGDILLTGTPGALALSPGSAMRAEIEGLGALEARVSPAGA